MNDRSCWGIFREREHSPGRESDDAEILRLTGKHLEARGYEVVLKTPDELAEPVESPPRFVFLMCERLEALSRLRVWEAAGTSQVNRPQAVLNTYREQMVATLAEAGVPFIDSHLISTASEVSAPTWPWPVWLKRADVHNTQEGDVTFAADAATFALARRGLAERGIARAVVQPHVDGDFVKFYGVGAHAARPEPEWFRWFYHKEQRLAGYPLDPRALVRLIRRAATALGLEVYGGDAIVTPAGALVLLDVNAWPSFALYRDEAAAAIAGYLTRRFEGGRR